MKKIAFLLTCILLATACEKNTEPNVFRIDPDAKVYVKASTNSTKSLETKASPEHLTPLEIVKSATYLIGYNELISGSDVIWTWAGKDTVSTEPALLRVASDIIYDTDGYGHYGLQTDFIYGHDFIICTGGFNTEDTIAYIPNANITNAREAILNALEAKDTAAVYVIFKEAFKFIPTTGAEWRQLKAQGLN